MILSYSQLAQFTVWYPQRPKAPSAPCVLPGDENSIDIFQYPSVNTIWIVRIWMWTFNIHTVFESEYSKLDFWYVFEIDINIYCSQEKRYQYLTWSVPGFKIREKTWNRIHDMRYRMQDHWYPSIFDVVWSLYHTTPSPGEALGPARLTSLAPVPSWWWGPFNVALSSRPSKALNPSLPWCLRFWCSSPCPRVSGTPPFLSRPLAQLIGTTMDTAEWRVGSIHQYLQEWIWGLLLE